MLVWLVVLVPALVWFGTTASQRVVRAEAYAYEGPQLERVDIVVAAAVGNASARARTISALRVVRPSTAQATSTTPSILVSATNTGLDASTLTMTMTVEDHLKEYGKNGNRSRPYGESILTLQEIIDSATARPDPQGVQGVCRWDVPGSWNGKAGTWELVVNIETGTIYHFLFKPS